MTNTRKKQEQLTMTNQDFPKIYIYVHKFLGVTINIKQIKMKVFI
jgi:hypothetical protein